MGPTWGPPGSCRPQMGPVNLAIRDGNLKIWVPYHFVIFLGIPNHLTWHARPLLKLFDEMYKYEMDPTRTIETTERTLYAGLMDGVKPIYPPNNFIVCGA